MVSLQLLTSPNERKTTIPAADNIQNDTSSSKKRKWDGDDEHQTEKIFHERSKSYFEIELQLDSPPLPLEWQQCLDIQSGEIHFYNTRTKKRTTRDPRRIPEPTSPGHMSLELELNLPCESQRKKDNENKHNFGGSLKGLGHLFMDSSKDGNKKSQGLKQCPSWLAFDQADEEEKEMVATVCTRCHMLVMLCKSSPACPNCKFVRPPDHKPPKLFMCKAFLC